MTVYLDFGVYSGFEKDWQLIYKAELILEETISDKHGHLFISLFCIRMSSLKEDTGIGIWRKRTISVMENYLHRYIFFVHVLTWCIYEKQDWPFWNNIYGDSQYVRLLERLDKLTFSTSLPGCHIAWGPAAALHNDLWPLWHLLTGLVPASNAHSKHSAATWQQWGSLSAHLPPSAEFSCYMGLEELLF